MVSFEHCSSIKSAIFSISKGRQKENNPDLNGGNFYHQYLLSWLNNPISSPLKFKKPALNILELDALGV